MSQPPERPNQPLHHGIPDDDLIKIARTILNWGAVDNHIGYSLNFIYGIKNPDHQIELISVVDMRKKNGFAIEARHSP